MTIVGVEETSYLCSQKEKTINNMKKIFLLAVLSTAISLNINATDVADPIDVDVELNDSSRVYDLDAVVIVAEPKENVRLRQQPLSSSLFSQNEMLSLGVRDLRELSQYVPSLTMPNYGSRYTSAVYVRGIGARINSPSVGMYVDGMPLASNSQYNSHLYGVERVDVLRGPQGTLYGMNAEGGLVRIYSRNPMSYQGTDLRLGAGTHGFRNLELATYQRLSETFALSVAGFYEGQNGFFRNRATGKRADKYDEAGGRLRLVWQPSERLSLDYLADYQFTRQNGFPYGLLEAKTGLAGPTATNEQGQYRRSMLNTALSATLNLPFATLNSTTSYQHLHDNMLMDIDYTPRDFQVMRQRQNQNALTEELTLKSNRRDSRWQWLGGVFFSQKWLETVAPVQFGDDWGAMVSAPINTAMYNAMLNSMAARMAQSMIERGMPEAAAMAAAQKAAASAIESAGGVSMDPAQLYVPGRFKTPQTNFGLFHQSSLRLTDRLTATLGLRYDLSHVRIDYDTRADMALTAHVMGQDATNILSSALSHTASNTFHQLLPKVGLTYELGDGSNLYATVSKGYRAGGYNIQNFSDIFNVELNANSSMANRGSYDIPHTEADYDNILSTISYEPETSWNYEVGSHLNLFDHALQLDLAAYYIQIRNQQLSQMASNYAFGRSMVNAGRSYSCGLEVAARGRAFDNHLNYSLSYGYTHAKFKEYDDVVDGVAVSYKDKRVPYVPKHTLAANADYRFDVKNAALNSITLGANVAAQGNIFWNEANTRAQGFYATLGAHLDFDFDVLTLSLWGRNLTNKNYTVFAFEYGHSATSPFYAQRANPTQVGIDLRFHF